MKSHPNSKNTTQTNLDLTKLLHYKTCMDVAIVCKIATVAEFIGPALILVSLLICAGFAIAFVRKRFGHGSARHQKQQPFTLEQLCQLRDDNQISQQEYKLLMDKILQDRET